MASINLKLTNVLYDAKIFFKDDMAMIWEPKYAPVIDDIMKFTREYRQAVRKKEIKKLLTIGHVKDIGSAWGIQSYRGQGYEGAISGK